MREVTLTGYLSLENSKRGERYLSFAADEPFFFHSLITVRGETEGDSDNDITEALSSVYEGLQVITCNIDQYGSLSTVPSKIRPHRDGEPFEIKIIES